MQLLIFCLDINDLTQRDPLNTRHAQPGRLYISAMRPAVGLFVCFQYSYIKFRLTHLY